MSSAATLEPGRPGPVTRGGMAAAMAAGHGPFAALLGALPGLPCPPGTRAATATAGRHGTPEAPPALGGLPGFVDRRDPPPTGPWLPALGLARQPHRAPRLPWQTDAGQGSGDRDEEGRFRRIRRSTLLAALLLGAALPFLPQPPPPAPAPALQVPAATARLLLPPPPAQRPSAPVPPVPPVPAAQAPVAAAPAVRPVAPVKAAPAVAEARQPVPDRAPGEALAAARRTASGVGLLAMKNELAQLSSAPVAAQLQRDIHPGPGVGTGSGAGVGAGTEAGLPARALVTAAAGRGSGGLGNSAAASRDTGGGGLAGRASTLVAGVAGGGGGGGPGGGGTARAGTGTGQGGSLQAGGSGLASRSIEDVKLVFERHKGAIYALYHRALRDDPTLQGKLVLELKIAASGAVTGLRVLSSELQAPELEAKLLARIRSFDFGAREVAPLVVSWPVDFLPS